MRSWGKLTTTLMSLALLVAASSVYADELLWDNYPGDVLQDVTVNMSCERNTQAFESTWVVDDVDLLQSPGLIGSDSDLALTRLNWVGARDPDFTYGAADVILLDTDRNTLLELSDLAYSFEDFEDPNFGPDTQGYVGEVVFDEPIWLGDLVQPGDPQIEHFYIGVRLVGDGVFAGRNHAVTSSVDETLRGRTEGHVKGWIFGAPDWRPASDVWFGYPTPDINFEFAFRLYAIPEPGSLALLLIGGLLLVRRR